MTRPLGILSAAASLGLLACASVSAAPTPDLATIDRRIAKEPEYTSKRPLYGLYGFGPRAATRVWAVLDSSEGGKDDYDVLYFDRDADGDLTELGERFT